MLSNQMMHLFPHVLVNIQLTLDGLIYTISSSLFSPLKIYECNAIINKHLKLILQSST